MPGPSEAAEALEAVRRRLPLLVALERFAEEEASPWPPSIKLRTDSSMLFIFWLCFVSVHAVGKFRFDCYSVTVLFFLFVRVVFC